MNFHDFPVPSPSDIFHTDSKIRDSDSEPTPQLPRMGMRGSEPCYYGNTSITIHTIREKMKLFTRMYLTANIAYLQYVGGIPTTSVQSVTIQGNVLLLNFSLLSASCANETLHLVNETYDIGCITNCRAENRTMGNCYVECSSDTYQTNCLQAGGQFYENQYEVEYGGVFSKCFTTIDEKSSIVDVYISNYPICVGVSCNDSEVKTAFDTTVVADGLDGPIGDSVDNACDIAIPGLETTTSGGYNHFNGRVYSTIHCAFTILIISNIVYVFFTD